MYFEQLVLECKAIRIAVHRLAQHLFGLLVTTVSNVDIGLGDRIDLAGLILQRIDVTR